MVSLTTLLFILLLVIALNWVARHLFANIIVLGIRERVTVELTAAMVAEILVLLLVTIDLRKRGLTLRSLGLSASSTRAGWMSAALVAALFLAFNLWLPLRNETRFSEISFFHIYNAVTAGFVAGFVEELLFRGYVMTEFQRSGWGNGGQAILSALSYGVVHASWGIISGVFTFQLIGGRRDRHSRFRTMLFGSLSGKQAKLASGDALPWAYRFHNRTLVVYAGSFHNAFVLKALIGKGPRRPSLAPLPDMNTLVLTRI